MKLKCRLSISFRARDSFSGKLEGTALSFNRLRLDKGGKKYPLSSPLPGKMQYREKKETLLIALNVKSCIWLTVSKRGFCGTLSAMEMCGCDDGSLSVLEETLLNQALGFKVCRALQQHTELHSPCSVHCTAPRHINVIYSHLFHLQINKAPTCQIHFAVPFLSS